METTVRRKDSPYRCPGDCGGTLRYNPYGTIGGPAQLADIRNGSLSICPGLPIVGVPGRTRYECATCGLIYEIRTVYG